MSKFKGFDKKNKIDKTDEDFIADSKAALLTKTTPFARRVLYTVLVFIVVGLIWAYFAKIEIIATGNGKVIPSSEVKVIQSYDGGIVRTLLVAEGNTVTPDQPLMELEKTRYLADFSQAYEKYLALSASVARLTAEVYQQSSVKFPKEVTEKYPDLVERETKLFRSRKESYDEKLLTYQNSLRDAKKELELYKPLLKEGVVSQVEFLRTQRSVYDIEQHIFELKDKYREDALAELNKNKAELASLSELLKTLRDKINRTKIVSPVKGIVKKIYIRTIGGVIKPGETIMEIVPLEDTLLVEAKINPKDIGFIKLGQPATVNITAFDYTIYGNLEGKVEYISPDVIEEQKPLPEVSGGGLFSGPTSLRAYYIVHVRTSKNYIGKETNKHLIIPGMQATARIMTGEKTILQYLLKPLIKAKTEAFRER